MPTKIKTCLYLALFVGSLFSFTLYKVSPAWGADNCQQSGVTYFSTAYQVSYNFTETGSAQITQVVSFTNLKETCSAHNYLLTIQSNKVSGVSASDNLGGLPVTTTNKSDGSTLLTVRVDANQQVVGLNKTQTVTVNYAIDGLAVKRGRIWDVAVPQIEAGGQVTAFKLILSVPNSFGKSEKMSPQPVETQPNGSSTNYIFGKESLNSSGIGASFGDYQEFSFTLKYHYKNPNLYDTKVSVALPLDTEYQAVYYQSIDPKPVSFSTDVDGNYLASYIINSGKNLEVVASGLVKIEDSSRPLQTPINWKGVDLSRFTKSDRYLQTQDSSIQRAAKGLKTPEAIYNFVTSTLKYDFSRLQNNSLGRRGAVEALRHPDKSICTDYADLFVTLARANGIPARGLVGYAYTDNSNLRPTKVEGLVNTAVLHAWAEYWDKEKGRWIQVDPTWGSTTGGIDYFHRLDTNHFAFVVNGYSSELPVAASPESSGDIKVDFSNAPLSISPKVSLNLDTSAITSGFLSNSQLAINNPTGRAIFQAGLAISSESTLGILNFDNPNLGIILPFSESRVTLKMRSNSLIDSKTVPVKITLTGLDQAAPYTTSVEKQIVVRPFFSLGYQQIILLFIITILIFAWAEPRFRRRALEKMGKLPWQD